VVTNFQAHSSEGVKQRDREASCISIDMSAESKGGRLERSKIQNWRGLEPWLLQESESRITVASSGGPIATWAENQVGEDARSPGYLIPHLQISSVAKPSAFRDWSLKYLVDFSYNPSFPIGYFSSCSCRYIFRFANFMSGVPCIKGSDRNIFRWIPWSCMGSLWRDFSVELLLFRLCQLSTRRGIMEWR
jgi:hypothetical protein